MKNTLTAAFVAFATIATGHMVLAQAPRPGEPNPTDRGSEFTITGCLAQEPATAGAPAGYILSNATAATGEARMVGAMGTGTPTSSAGSIATRPSDPPHIVASEYRVVAREDVDLSKHVNKKVQLRGMLPEAGGDARRVEDTARGAAAAPQDRERASSANSASTAASDRDTPDVFIALSAEAVADSCAG